MARDSIAHAKAEVFALLGDPATNVSTIANVSAAYRFDPGQSLTGGPIVLTLQTIGLDPSNFNFELRLYCDLGVDPSWVQDALDGVINDIEQVLESLFGDFGWSIEPHPDNESWLVARRVVQVIREGPGLWR